MDTIHYKNLISNNDVIKLLEEVGFKEIKIDSIEPGYLLEPGANLTQQIRVYLKSEYLYIGLLTPEYINLGIYKQEEGPISYYHGTVNHYRSWFRVKSVRYKIEEGLEGFRDFLLLSICRDSFLDPEEEDIYRYGNNMDVDEFRIRENSDWYGWIL